MVNDIKTLFESLGPVAPSSAGPYTFEDQKRDFWDVLARTDQGRRVLSQIAAFCEGPPIGPPLPDDDNYEQRIIFRSGMKWPMHLITRAMAGNTVAEKED